MLKIQEFGRNNFERRNPAPSRRGLTARFPNAVIDAHVGLGTRRMSLARSLVRSPFFQCFAHFGRSGEAKERKFHFHFFFQTIGSMSLF